MAAGHSARVGGESWSPGGAQARGNIDPGAVARVLARPAASRRFLRSVPSFSVGALGGSVAAAAGQGSSGVLPELSTTGGGRCFPGSLSASPAARAAPARCPLPSSQRGARRRGCSGGGRRHALAPLRSAFSRGRIAPQDGAQSGAVTWQPSCSGRGAKERGSIWHKQ